MGSPQGKAKADAFKDRVKRIVEEFDAAFPGQYTRTKETLQLHLEQMSTESAGPFDIRLYCYL
jgi:hypothetical protein